MPIPRKYIEHILSNGGLMVMNPEVESVKKTNIYNKSKQIAVVTLKS